MFDRSFKDHMFGELSSAKRAIEEALGSTSPEEFERQIADANNRIRSVLDALHALTPEMMADEFTRNLCLASDDALSEWLTQRGLSLEIDKSSVSWEWYSNITFTYTVHVNGHAVERRGFYSTSDGGGARERLLCSLRKGIFDDVLAVSENG